jgi:CDP-diglyceride synthetase
MFRQRLLTTLVLVPLVLLALYYANNLFFSGVALLLVVACGLEWLQLIPIERLVFKVVYLVALVMACYFISFLDRIWLITGLGVWCVILFLVPQFPKSQEWWGYPWVVVVFGLVLLPLFGQSMVLIFSMPQGKGLIVYLLFLVWGADIGAYLAGKLWGTHKLIPAVSPGKTIEGVTGGIVLSSIVAAVGYYCFQPQPAWQWFILFLATVLISLLGDLFISMLKRRTHIKDTGHIIPGHGGILDRLDSLIAAAPLFYALLYFFSPTLSRVLCC